MRTPKLFFAALMLLAFSLFAASDVRADGTYDYVYVSGGNTFTWQLLSSPVITSGNASLGNYFTIPGLSISENGVATTADLDFNNTAAGGGFDIWNGTIFLSNAFGPQLYSGPENAPTLLTGTFSLTEVGNFDVPPSAGTLNVTSVPEPSTLSFLAIGVGMGLALFLSRKN